MLVDVTQNYGGAFYSCAAGMGLSAVFLGLVKPAKKGLLCGKRGSETKQDCKEEEREEEKTDKRTKSPNHCSESHDHEDTSQTGATRDTKEDVHQP